MKLTDYLNAINYSKKNLMDTDDDDVERKYPAFVVNRCMSYFPDTILYANEMNRLSHLDNKMQFSYYLHSVRKRKRFSKWLKNENPADLDLIKSYFGYNNKRAREALEILSEKDIEHIRAEMNTGGVKK